MESALECASIRAKAMKEEKDEIFEFYISQGHIDIDPHVTMSLI